MALASCSNCGKSTEVSIPRSINTALDPDLKSRVRDGSLFIWECPYCGRRSVAVSETLYHDPASKLMVWLLPGTEVPSQAAQDAVKDLEGYTLRMVREVGELIEKINIADAGLEDTIVEMCKWVTRRELAAKNPAAANASLKFLRIEGADHDLVFAFPLDGNMQLVNVGFNVYEDARGILSRNPSVKPSDGFSRVNSEWLERFFQ
ncbi:MAG: CpXC domain-containing protein [Bacteroidales bacterium]|nr:CpXC domain-containing protein [Bacteroidales bacterium]